MKKTPVAILSATIAANLERDERYSEAEMEWNTATCQSQNVFNQMYFDNRRDFCQKMTKRILAAVALANKASGNTERLPASN